MANVVFTGQAIDAQGNLILRADLASAAMKAGWTVWDQMHPGVNLLVASRTDTVKAKQAKAMHVKVWTYGQFLQDLAKAGQFPALAHESKAKANAYTDPGAVALVTALTAAQKHGEAVAPFQGRGKIL